VPAARVDLGDNLANLVLEIAVDVLAVDAVDRGDLDRVGGGGPAIPEAAE